MKAMLLKHHGPIEEQPLRFRDVPAPEPMPGQIRVKVTCCAVCRTDLHVIEADLPPQKIPIIPGHQIVGKVDSVGASCKRLRPGKRVGIAWLRHTCGTCSFCRRGRENLCEASQYTGYHADGGYAEYAVVNEDFAYELPDMFSDVDAAPLLCAGIIGYRALKRACVPATGKLLLVGFGSSAHIVLQIAIHRQYEVYVLSRSEGHQALARRMGATWAGADPADLPTRPDSAIVFAPAGTLVPPVLEALQKGGTLSLAGIHMTPIPELDYQKHLYYERDIHSVTANTRQDGRELLAEAAEAGVKPHVTTYPLAEANRALQDMKHSRVDGTGVLVIGL